MGPERAKCVLEKYQGLFMAIPGVVGLSTGVFSGSIPRRFCIKVYLSRPIPRGSLQEKKIPMEMEEIPVEIVFSGPFHALKDNS